MSQEIRIGDEYLTPLSGYERLSVLCNMWPSLPSTAQTIVVKIAACVMGLDLPEADSELAVVLANWPMLTNADRTSLATVARLGGET